MTDTGPKDSPLDRWIMIVGLAAIPVLIWFWFFKGDDGTSSPPPPRTASSYADEFGGDVGKYAAILEWTDCADLARGFRDGKANFDANAAGVREQWRGQMEVTSDRMDALGCP